MANLTTGTAGPLDMTNLQIMSLQFGGTPVYNTTLVRVDAGGGRYDDFQGSGYTYASGGDPYYGGGGGTTYDPMSGTVTRLVEVMNGVISMDLSGVSVNAPTLFSAFRTHDANSVLNLLLGGDDQISGGSGADSLDGWGGNDSMAGGDGADFMRGLEGNDNIDGGLGNDDINGNLGADVVFGGDGADFVRGGQGNDTVSGAVGDDVHVNGNIGDDIVHGDDGNDTVFGGQGNDAVFGDAGADQLSGDLGNDTLTGGAGADSFLFRTGSGLDTITDFNATEGDRIVLPTGTSYTVANVGGQAVIDLGGGDQLTLSGVSPGSFSAGWVVFV